MKRIIVLLTILLYLPLALLSFEANAQDDDSMASGNGLLSFCKKSVRLGEGGHRMADVDMLEGVACSKFVWGFLRGTSLGIRMAAIRVYGIDKAMSMTLEERATALGAYCMPKGVQTDQVIRIVVRYLENHPERLHFQPMILVHSALFPVETSPSLRDWAGCRA